MQNPLNENYLIDKIVNQNLDVDQKADTKPNDIAKFLFTSGSTGTPKVKVMANSSDVR